jgi:hypothetical protein
MASMPPHTALPNGNREAEITLSFQRKTQKTDKSNYLVTLACPYDRFFIFVILSGSEESHGIVQ